MFLLIDDNCKGAYKQKYMLFESSDAVLKEAMSRGWESMMHSCAEDLNKWLPEGSAAICGYEDVDLKILKIKVQS